MRVLVVTHYFSEHRSGVEIIAGELAQRWARRGVEVTWVATDEGHGGGNGKITRRPVTGWNFTERKLGFPYPIWAPWSLARLWREVARCDIVHLHDSLYMGNAAAYAAARYLGKPVVVTQHIGAVPYSRRLLRGLLETANRTVARVVLAGADRSVFYSPKVRRYFADLFRTRRSPVDLPNGVATETFHPVDPAARRILRDRLGWRPDRPVLLFVGRFVEKKGLKFLGELARDVQSVDWVFVGWGAEDPARWGLPNVMCVGSLPQEEIVRYYQAADLLVLPSVGEGFPLVVQEAMACGLPVMTSPDTAAGGVGIDGLVYSVELQQEAWRRELTRLTGSIQQLEAQRGAVACFARATWDWEHCADRYLQLFETVRKERAQRSRLGRGQPSANGSSSTTALSFQVENADQKRGETCLHAENE
jgi:glycosyltransferase involved in cell wall biosynthesis